MGDDVQQRHRHSVSFLEGAVTAPPSSSSSLSSSSSSTNPWPHVTLTFAQTVDGYISGKAGRQLRLSGDDSMAMTHQLRTMHEAILVGVGTVLNDNPRLSARLLPEIPPQEAQPQPIILDSKLRTPPDCRLISNWKAGAGKRPIVLHSSEASESNLSALTETGVKLVCLSSMEWEAILDALGRLSVHSVMVEGGSRVIESLLTARRSSRPDGAPGKSGGCIDTLIVTVSPNFAGSNATGYKSPRWSDVAVTTGKKSVEAKKGQEEEEEGAAFQVVRRDFFGDDAVWMWKRAG